MGDTGERVRRGLRAAFGQVSLAAAAVGLQHRVLRARSWRQRPRVLARAQPAARGARRCSRAHCSSSRPWCCWRWYENRPQPVEVAFTVTAPPVTCYACEPPGAPNPLIVRFDASTAPLERVGHAVEPQQAGISMQPAARRSVDLGRRQDAALPARERLADRPALRSRAVAQGASPPRTCACATTSFEFDAPAFDASVAATEFHQDPVVAGNKKVGRNIAFTHPVDPESFEKRVRLQMFDRVTDKIEKELAAPTHTVVYDKLKLNAYVHSAQLEVPPKAGRLNITIEPGVHAARGGNETREKLTTNVEVPGLNSLKIADVALDIVRDERNEPNQVLLVTTSFSVLGARAAGEGARLAAAAASIRIRSCSSRSSAARPSVPWSSATLRPEVLRDRHAARAHADSRRARALRAAQLPLQRRSGPLRLREDRCGPASRSAAIVLGDSVERIIRVPEFPRELSILHQGSLLSMSGEKTLSLFARNVPAMRIEVGRAAAAPAAAPRHADAAATSRLPQFHELGVRRGEHHRALRATCCELPPAPPGQGAVRSARSR